MLFIDITYPSFLEGLKTRDYETYFFDNIFVGCEYIIINSFDSKNILIDLSGFNKDVSVGEPYLQRDGF
jgi:hypothetical protein